MNKELTPEFWEQYLKAQTQAMESGAIKDEDILNELAEIDKLEKEEK